MGKQNVCETIAIAVTAREIVEAFKNHAHLFLSESILNRFLGLTIYARGRIVNQDTVGFGLGYLTAVIDDDGIFVSCNFDKPVPPEVAKLKKGEQINVHGIVSNANKDIVVLVRCHLLSLSTVT
jgi:hypothetical protein